MSIDRVSWIPSVDGWKLADFLTPVKYGKSENLRHAILKLLSEHHGSTQCSVRFAYNHSLPVSLFSNSSIDNRKQTSHNSYRYGRMGCVIPFFIDRWEKEKNKPQFYVISPSEPTGDVEIRVRVKNQFFGRKARFYLVSAGNSGVYTAEDVEFVIRVPEAWQTSQTLFPLAPPERDFFSIDWLRPEDEFEDKPEKFARALVLSAMQTLKEREKPKLYGKGVAGIFTLFHTVEGSKAAFFPSESTLGVDSDSPFHIDLYIQAKDLPKVRVATFEVNVHEWNNVDVTPTYFLKTSSITVLNSQQSSK